MQVVSRPAPRFLSLLKKIGPLTLIIALCVGAFWLGITGMGRPAPNAGLVVDEGSLNLGEIWQTDSFIWNLPIKNDSERKIEILDFSASCTCVEIEPRKLTIQPGETKKVRLTISLTEEDSKEEKRPINLNVTPIVKAESAVQEGWKLTGVVKKILAVDPPTINIGRVSELAQPLPQQRTIVKAYAALQSLTATSNSKHIDVEVKRCSTFEIEQFEIVVTPKGIVPLGEFHETIDLLPQLRNGENAPIQKLDVSGTIVCDIDPSPPTILFGALPIGVSKEETITLQSLTGKPFTVLNAYCRGSGLSVAPIPSSPSIRTTFRVNQKVETPGEWSGRIVLTVSSSGDKNSEIVVPVSFYGTSNHR
jgi:hypothetical protein